MYLKKLAIMLMPIILCILMCKSEKVSPQMKQPVQESSPQAKQTITMKFDIPTLLTMSIKEVKAELGKPVSEFVPNKSQLQLDPNFASTVEYEKGTTNIQIDYSRSGKVLSIFISDGTVGRTEAEIMKLGNLEPKSSDYIIKVTQWINPKKAKQIGSAEIAGIAVMPR